MRKNMYSLMLTEDVVAAIDKLAAAEGVSRSGFINGILAEYVSYRTPEMRMRDMFNSMEQLFHRSDEMQVMLRSSDSLFNLRSMLSYKYNPAVNYSIELYRAPSRSAIGEVRVSLRTQNNSLKLYLMQFYKLWAKIEANYHPEIRLEISGERFTKYLVLPANSHLTEDDLCGMIADYITAFDKALKEFFAHLDNAETAVLRAEQCYLEYFRKYRAAL